MAQVVPCESLKHCPDCNGLVGKTSIEFKIGSSSARVVKDCSLKKKQRNPPGPMMCATGRVLSDFGGVRGEARERKKGEAGGKEGNEMRKGSTTHL